MIEFDYTPVITLTRNEDLGIWFAHAKAGTKERLECIKIADRMGEELFANAEMVYTRSARAEHLHPSWYEFKPLELMK